MASIIIALLYFILIQRAAMEMEVMQHFHKVVQKILEIVLYTQIYNEKYYLNSKVRPRF
jgi:hypothetical protein